jgi:hypothetical protein
MSETYAVPGLASYADTVAELMRAGESFDDVTDAIDEVVGLSEDARAALWLLAFSMRAPGKRPLAAAPHLVLVD